MATHTIFDKRPETQDRALKILEKLGYTIVPRSEAEQKRGSRKSVLFEDELRLFLSKRTYMFGNEKRFFSGGSIANAIRAINLKSEAGLFAVNKETYDLLCTGKSLEESLPDGTRQSFDIDYIDFEYPENNTFQVTDEFEMEYSNGKFASPDIVVLVNGIPIVVIECKKFGVDVMEGVKQNIGNCGPNNIPQLFQYAQLVLKVNPDKVLYGTCGTPYQYYVSWHEDDKDWLKNWCRKCSPDGQTKEQDRALVSLLQPKRLLDLVRNYIIYDNNVKKIARYNQYFAIQKCMDRILLKDDAGTRNGFVWHAVGSGKTMTMLMLTKMILRESLRSDSRIKDPRFIMVTDRIDLDKQIHDNFTNNRMSPQRATTGKGLIELLKNDGNTVVTALINKFEAAIKQDYSNEKDNFFLFMDEEQRTQDDKLNIYMNKVLPNAAKIAFTETPLLKQPKNSGKESVEGVQNNYLKFGPLIDKYTWQDAIDDRVTVPIIYEGRVIPQNVTSRQINEHLKHITVGLADDARKELEQKYYRFVTLAQTKQRMNMVAFDLREHFTRYVKPKGYKAILTCSSRAAAVEMFYLLKNLGGIKPVVVITSHTQKEGYDEEDTKEHEIIADFFRKEVDPVYKNNYKTYVDFVKGTFNNPEGDIDLLIVTDELLTGFDVPIAGVLYVDKALKDHTFLQAMGRVNHAYKSKDFGLIVDYADNFKNLSSALDLYSDEKSGMSGFDREDIGKAIFAVSEQKTMLEIMHKELWRVFEGISKKETSTNVWQERLREYDIRKDFYEKLSSFAKQVDFLYASYGLFESVGFEKSEEYRHDYLFFKKLKDSVLLRFNDSVDFTKYEDDISHLLNTYVNAEDAKIIIEPLDILNKDKIREQLARLESNDAKAEAVQNRLVEVLECSRNEDPIMYMTFMDRINETIQEYLSDRDSEKYLSSMEEMAEDYRVGRSSFVYPEIIMDDGNAKAFYDAVCTGIKMSPGEVSGNNEDGLGRLSLQIKSTIVKNVKRDWRDNVIVHKNIKKQLDDLLFDYMEDNNLNWTFDTIDNIIDEIIKVANKRYHMEIQEIALSSSKKIICGNSA